jgi:hypothetical protein
MAGLPSPRPHAAPTAAITQSSVKTGRRRRLIIEPILQKFPPSV